MLILGIDTTCDDTSVGLVEDGRTIHANVIASQHMTLTQVGRKLLYPGLKTTARIVAYDDLLGKPVPDVEVTAEIVQEIAQEPRVTIAIPNRKRNVGLGMKHTPFRALVASATKEDWRGLQDREYRRTPTRNGTKRSRKGSRSSRAPQREEVRYR